MNVEDDAGRTPLDWAKENNKPEMVKYLESIGGKSGDGDPIERTPPAPQAAVTFTAEEQKEIDAFLKEWDTDEQKKELSEHAATLLHVAASNPNVAVTKYLVSKGADVNAKADNGVSPLHIAVGEGNIEVVKYLVSQGTDVNVKANNGTTPLDIAKETGNTEVIRYLESVGTKSGTNLPNAEVNTPVIFTAEEQKKIDMFVAANGRDIKAVDDRGMTLLHSAIEWGDAVVKYLVSIGADVNVRDTANQTLLHWTALGGEVEIAKYLVSKGVNVNAKHKFGATALHFAAHNGHIEVVRFLVSQRADVNAKDEFGDTPLDVAKENENTEVVKYLESVGGKSGK